MIVLRAPLARRTMLRGLGTIVALPFLEAMTPPTLLRAPSGCRSSTPPTG